MEHIPYIAFFVVFTFAKAFNTLMSRVFGLSALVGYTRIRGYYDRELLSRGWGLLYKM